MQTNENFSAAARSRNLAQMGTENFDVLVVGGGIQGATIAWATARRGLRVALVETADWGAGASANSLKIIHGGLRYLQHANLVRMRESIRARRRIIQLAPATVEPLACIMPGRGWGLRNPLALLAALTANAVLSADRNRGAPANRRLPAGRLISRRALEAAFPLGIFRDESAGMVWYDAIAQDIDRLTLAFVEAAANFGAVTANYAKATQWLRDGDKVVGATVEDTLTGLRHEVRATHVVCSAGPGTLALSPNAGAPRWVKAINLVLKKPLVQDYALAIESKCEYRDSNALIQRGHRNFFVVPWQGGTMVGTLYVPYDPAKDPLPATAGEILELMKQVNETGFLPPIQPGDICRVHSGAQAAGKQDTEPATQTQVLRAAPGLWVVQGVKYTTALETADDVADRLARGRRRPADEPLPWREPPQDLAALVAQAVDSEMAVRLEDVIMRRSHLGFFGLPDEATVTSCADAMARRLGWDVARREAEIAALRQAHSLPPLGE